MVALLGIVGGLLFGFAAVPQAVATLEQRRHLGTPLSIILAVLGGTVEAASWAVLLAFARRL